MCVCVCLIGELGWQRFLQESKERQPVSQSDIYYEWIDGWMDGWMGRAVAQPPALSFP